MQHNLYFMPYAAPSPIPNRKWMQVSPSGIRRSGLIPSGSRIFSLKMDCEGCEYAIYPWLVNEEPNFFDFVDSFAIEVHISKHFMTSVDDFWNYAKFLAMLKRAGLELVHSKFGECSYIHWKGGCIPEVYEVKYPCDMEIACQMFTFGRRVRRQS